MDIEEYNPIDWLKRKKNFSVIRVFSDIECDEIISSIEDNIDKLKVSNENGWLYLSAYEMQTTELPVHIQDLINKVVEKFGDFKLNQSFIIKYNKNLISNMPCHYDGSYLSLPINLNNNFTGGGTNLPFLKYKYTPQDYPRGCGLLFRANTIKSWHEALPVIEGDRYVLVLKFNTKTNLFSFILTVLKLLVAAKFIETFIGKYKIKKNNIG